MGLCDGQCRYESSDLISNLPIRVQEKGQKSLQSLKALFLSHESESCELRQHLDVFYHNEVFWVIEHRFSQWQYTVFHAMLANPETETRECFEYLDFDLVVTPIDTADAL